jgi:vitamin B12 transporter
MKMKIFVVAATIISSSSTKQLDEVVVTATRYPLKQSETGKVISVINREALEKSSGKTLPEILNTVAGISINGANNNLGSIQTLNIRGAAAGNALILIDGVPVNDPSVIYNYFDLNLLVADQIERIEILKGGQSTLYGSDAVAGVINVITKKSTTKKLSVAAGIAGGSYGTIKTHAGLSGHHGIINYNLQYSHIHSDGFSSAYDSSGNKNFDRDSYHQNVLLGNIGLQLNNHLSAKITGQYSHYKTAVDAGGFTDEKDYTSASKNLQFGTGLIYKWRQATIHINYLFNKVTRSYLDDSAYRSDPSFYYSNSKYIGLTHYAELYANHQWKNAALIAGIDYRYNKTTQDYFSYGIYGPFSTSLNDSLAHMWQLSPYGSLLLKFNKQFGLEAGGRWNHHSVYGNNFTYTFNPFYHISKNVKLFTNLYSAFKTPSLYQLFDPYAGNKDLKPEKSTIVEAGTELAISGHLWMRAVYFYGNTKNSIQYITVDPVNFISKYQNISRQKNYGIELELSEKIGKWNFTANYTYTDGKTASAYDATGNKLTNDTTYNNLYRIPKNAFNLSAGFQVTDKISVATSLHTVSKRWEPIYASAPVALAAYYTIDISGEYRLSKALHLFINLKNITNQLYFDTRGYNSRRFNCMAGATFNL